MSVYSKGRKGQVQLKGRWKVRVYHNRWRRNKKWDIAGGFTADLNIQLAYQSFPTGNGQMINAQFVLDNIAGWLEDVENLPKLTGNRKITKFTTSDSFSAVEEVEGDKATVYVSNVVMEYRKKGA